MRSPFPARGMANAAAPYATNPASAPSGPNTKIPAAAPTPVARMLLGAVSDRATGGE